MKIAFIALCLLVGATSQAQNLTVPNSLSFEGYGTLGKILTTDIENSEFKDIFTQHQQEAEKSKVLSKFEKEINTCQNEVECLKSVMAKQNVELSKLNVRVKAMKAKYGNDIKAINASMLAANVVESLNDFPYFQVLPQTIQIKKLSAGTRMITLIAKSLDNTKLVNVSITTEGDDTSESIQTDILNFSDVKVRSSMEEEQIATVGKALIEGLFTKQTQVVNVGNIKISHSDLK